jgi:hypothetical protein
MRYTRLGEIRDTVDSDRYVMQSTAFRHHVSYIYPSRPRSATGPDPCSSEVRPKRVGCLHSSRMSYIRVGDEVGIQTIGQDGIFPHRNNRISMEPFFIEIIGQVWYPSLSKQSDKYGTLLLGISMEPFFLGNLQNCFH